MPVKEKERAQSEPERAQIKASIEKYTPVLQKMQEGSQNYHILKYMIENGGITPKEAEKKPIYSMRLSARIYELKHDHKIPIEKEIIFKKRGKKNIPHARYYIKDA